MDAERMVEALLFAAAEPLSVHDLAHRLPEGTDVGQALATLSARYAGRGVELECVADRWRFRTAPDLGFLMVEEREEPRRLSRARSRRWRDRLPPAGHPRRHRGRPRRSDVSRHPRRAAGARVRPHARQATLAGAPGDLRDDRQVPGALRPLQPRRPSGASDLRAAGLLDLDLPADFALPDPTAPALDEDPLDPGDEAQFHQDFLSEGER
jgi:segregation and condensation protein B